MQTQHPPTLEVVFDGNPIRYILRDGEPWFVAADVCRSLGYRDANAGTRFLDEDEKATHILRTPGGNQASTIVSEAGLYRLILGARMRQSDTAEVRELNERVMEFKRWVTHNVLPSIRKHGMYATDALLDDPDHLLRVTTRLVEERKARLAAEAQVALMAPKAEFHDKVAAAADCQSIGSVAKVLGSGQNRLFSWLRGQRILLENNQPYQDFIDAGYFRVIEQTWEDKEGKAHLTTKTLVTGRGLAWLQKRFHGKDNLRTMAT